MLKTTRILVMAGVMAAVGSEARAQTQPPPATLGFVNVNFGTQPSSRTFGRSESFPVYGETATLTTDPGESAMAPCLRHHRGLPVRPNLFGPNLGARDRLLELQQYLRQRSRRHASRIRWSSIGRKRSTRASATWSTASEASTCRRCGSFRSRIEIDVALSAGPSFIRVSQDLVSSVTIPPGTQNANPNVVTEKKTAIGFNIGVDGTLPVHQERWRGRFPPLRRRRGRSAERSGSSRRGVPGRCGSAGALLKAELVSW